jgi:prepilin-type processing-associated H-X9-DG protein
MPVRHRRAGLAAALLLALPACRGEERAHEASRRNLEEIGRAVSAAAGMPREPGAWDFRMRYPFPAGYCGPDRKSVGLSWRVAALPHLGQDDLFRQFKLDEAWDSPHNMALVPRMPAVYALPGVKDPDGRTHYRGLAGPQGVFRAYPSPDRHKPGDPLNGLAPGFEISDGTSNTIMVVEAEEPVVWTKPDDLPVGGDHPAPKLRAVGGRANVLFCDGTVRALPANIPEANLKALCTAAGGEPGSVQTIP